MMQVFDAIQLLFFVTVLTLLTKPTGLLLTQALNPDGKTFLDPALKPIERLIYRLLNVQSDAEQDWKHYSFSLLVFSLISLLFTYAILRLQHLLPLNPQHLGPISPDLAFNTAVSFTTNTNWQNYAGESTMSYFSQMVGLTLHNFTSAAVGIAACAALVRGIARKTAGTIGNFWTDLVRGTLYVLLPISMVLAVLLLSQGMIQNFQSYAMVKTLEGSSQTIAQGPMASQVAIKMLGTNGGGFTNANATHPYENPTPFSNFLQMLAIFLIPAGLTYYLGREVKHQKHGWAIWSAMLALFLAGVLVIYSAELHGNPRHITLGVDAADGNMEGKEQRFGILNSALFATITTDASCGAVNSMHDSFMPLGGLIPLLNIQLGEVIFGGVGSGLYGMLLFVILAIFVAGLMVGRTPEYLGKKLGAVEVKLAALGILVPIFPILIFTAWGAVSTYGTNSLSNSGPHGFSELLYAFSSGAGNNGSAFAGLNANTVWWNTMLAFAMIIGRFGIIVPVLALAGKLAAKKQADLSDGSFPVSGVLFTVLLVGTILIVGALTFFPALAMGPILEHFLMLNSHQLF
jgi:potassium-transporting ATPase potassium-binding subunit